MRENLMKFAAVAAVMAGMAFAQQAAPTPQPAPARPVRAAIRRRVMQALNLTDAQKQQAKTIFQQARQNAQPIAAQLQQNRDALAAAVKANQTAQIQALATAQGSLRGQVLTIRAGALAQFYQILTPDQRTKADQVQQRIRQRLQQRRQGANG